MLGCAVRHWEAGFAGRGEEAERKGKERFEAFAEGYPFRCPEIPPPGREEVGAAIKWARRSAAGVDGQVAEGYKKVGDEAVEIVTEVMGEVVGTGTEGVRIFSVSICWALSLPITTWLIKIS